MSTVESIIKKKTKVMVTTREKTEVLITSNYLNQLQSQKNLEIELNR